MHDERTLSEEDVTQAQLGRMWRTQPVYFIWLILIGLRLCTLKRCSLEALFHLLVDLLNASHDLVPIEQCTAPLLLKTVTQSLTDGHQQPGVAWHSFPYHVAEVVKCKG